MISSTQISSISRFRFWKYGIRSLLLTGCFCIFSFGQIFAQSLSKPSETDSKALNYYMEGMRLEMGGEFDSAAKAYLRAVRADSSSATLFFALARAQLRVGEIQDAENALMMVAKLDSVNTDALKMLAEIANARKAPETALIYLQQILRINPDDPYTLGDVAETYRALGDSLKEAETLEKIFDVNPRAIQALGRAEQIYLNSKQFEKALQLYRKLLASMPDNTELIERELRLLVALERIPEADTFIDSVVAAHPNSGEFIALKGQYLGNVKGEDAAIKYLEAEILDPEVNWQPRMMLGQIYFEQKQYDKAIAPLQSALKDNPALPAAVSFIALSELNMDRAEEAYRLLENYIAAFPDNFFLHYLLGSVARDLGTLQSNNNLLEEALGVLTRALELKHDDQQALHTYATTADQLERNDLAMSAYRKLLKAFPDDDLAMNNYAYMISEQETDTENLLSAAELIQKALRITPENPSYLDTAGWVYFKLGHLNAAREMLEKSLAIDPTNREVLGHMAEVLNALGQKDAAERYRQESQKVE